MEKITKETSDGKCVYRDEEGKIISTYFEGVEEIADVYLEPLHDFIQVMSMNADGEGVDLEKTLIIAERLLKTAREKIRVASQFIRENHGIVEIERASYSTRQYVEPETMLGVVSRPCQGVTA